MRIALTCFLLATATNVLPMPFKQGQQMQLPSGYTSVFRWDEETFGLLHPGNGELLLIPATGAARTLALEGGVRHRSGSVYPDAISRTGDTLHWMTRSDGIIHQFSVDGKYQKSVTTGVESPFSFHRDADGSFLVYGTASERPIAHYHRLTEQGKLIAKKEGWLKAQPRNNHFAWEFSFKHGSDEIQLLAHFPYARVSGRTVDIGSCAALPQSVTEVLTNSRHRLPAPLGEGYQPPSTAAYPFILAAAQAPNGDVYAVGNGSMLYRISTKALRSECWAYPEISSTSTYFLSSVAATSRHVAVLVTLADGGVVLQMWDLERSASTNERN